MAGIPYPKHTDSGEPLATDLGKQLRWMIPQAYQLFRIYEVRPAKDSAEAREAARPRHPDEKFGLLFTVYDWHNEISSRMNLRHDVGLEVVGPDGRTLATRRSTLDERFSQPELSQQTAAIFFRLLNAPTVVAALEGTPATGALTPASSGAVAPAPATDDPTPWPSETQPAAQPPPATRPKCSVDQVLKLSELKFTDAQIKAACE